MERKKNNTRILKANLDIMDIYEANTKGQEIIGME